MNGPCRSSPASVPARVAHQATRSSHQARASTRGVSRATATKPVRQAARAGRWRRAGGRPPRARPPATSRCRDQAAPRRAEPASQTQVRTLGFRHPSQRRGQPIPDGLQPDLDTDLGSDGANIRSASGQANPPDARPRTGHTARRPRTNLNRIAPSAPFSVPVAAAITIICWRHGWPGSGRGWMASAAAALEGSGPTCERRISAALMAPRRRVIGTAG